MDKQSADREQLRASLELFVLLLFAIFVTELAVMELFPALFTRLGPVLGGMLDAGMMVLFFAAPLWLLLANLFPSQGSADPPPSTRLALLAQALGGIFLIEYLVTQFLAVLGFSPESLGRNLTDAGLTALFCAGPLWWLLFRPGMRRHSVPLMDTPLRLYVLLLGTIFFSDLLQDLVLPMAAGEPFGANRIVDAFLTTLCGVPLLWLMVARPLKRAIRSERARILAVHAQVVDAIVVLDLKGVISSFNPAAEKIFGYRAAEIIGGCATQLLERGEQGLDDLVRQAVACVGDGVPARFGEIGCRRRDGLTLVMDVSISEVLLEGKPELLLIMRDITGRKRMEEALRESETRFREIFQQSEEAIVFFKPGGSAVLDANTNAEKLFGYCKAELQGGALEKSCAPDEFALLELALAGVGEGKSAQQTLHCRRRDGGRLTVSLHARIMRLQGVAVTHCSFCDISDRVAMEERSREIQARLIQANKMTSLGLLVSGVAHEINNPNNFIMANCELLTRICEDSVTLLEERLQEEGDGAELYAGGVPLSELRAQSRRLCGGIAEGARRVDDIVRGLKGFARQEKSQMRHDLDLSAVARSAVSLMHHELIKFTNNFHLELAPELPPVTGHGQQLGQVIINLLMNACQALPGKGSGIWLATAYDPAERAVIVSVRDEGRGMSREESRRIMEPFFTTKLDSGGTGLGLSISESIVKEHGGTLQFSSVPGQGTTFSVRLPVAAGTSQ